MNQATVTINYNSFQEIKEKADRLDALTKENAEYLSKEGAFIDKLCHCIESANEQKTFVHQQYFIAQGIIAICERFEMDIETDFIGIDYGKAPATIKK